MFSKDISDLEDAFGEGLARFFRLLPGYGDEALALVDKSTLSSPSF